MIIKDGCEENYTKFMLLNELFNMFFAIFFIYLLSNLVFESEKFAKTYNNKYKSNINFVNLAHHYNLFVPKSVR